MVIFDEYLVLLVNRKSLYNISMTQRKDKNTAGKQPGGIRRRPVSTTNCFYFQWFWTKLIKIYNQNL